MKKNLLPSLLLFLMFLGLSGAVWADAPPTAATPSLATALNPDGTLRPGANGSFDARAFRMRTAPDGRPVFRPAGVAGSGDERWADGFGVFNGTDGVVSAVIQTGADTYIGGAFTTVGNVAANGVARWNGTTWSSLGTGTANGVSGTVYALAVGGNGDVYAGGSFLQAGGTGARYVARWSGTTWSSLGTGTANGVNNAVNALAVAGNGDVYAGGFFTQAGGATANYVARWNGTTWSSLGTGTANGVNSPVLALAVAGNGTLYAGGYFNQAGGSPASFIARWSGTAWSSLGTGTANGVNNAVNALAVAGNGDVYAGGDFTQAGGTTANRVAQWSGTAWSSLGTGTANGGNDTVYALTVAANGDVYIGGAFKQAGGTAANYVARWNGTAWSSLGTGAANGVGNAVNALAVAHNGTLYASGTFVQAGGAVARYVASWGGTAWSSLGTGANGLDTVVDALAVAGNGDVYVGGYFERAGGVIVNGVARWNGTAWTSLGAGISAAGQGNVRALAVAGNGDVYAGGAFAQAGGVVANNVARWNGTNWSSLGTGTANGLNGTVYGLVVAGNGDVYVGGYFDRAGGVVANGIAKWNGTTWSSLGTGAANGLRGNVQALAVANNGNIYAAGSIYQAGNVSVNGIAKWNGTTWSSLGAGAANGMNNTVLALAVAGNGEVYAGGFFDLAGGVTARGVARWNGTAWSSLGSGTGITTGGSGAVSGLAVASNGDVYVSGAFAQASGVAANRIAKWNGTVWSSLGTGLNLQASALAIGLADKVYAGGGFTTTGDGSKAMAYFAIYDPNAPLATKAPVATFAALFPNPAHGTATLRLPIGAPRLHLTLTDALGRTVRQYPAPATAEAELDLRGLPAGTYVVRCGSVSQRLVME